MRNNKQVLEIQFMRGIAMLVIILAHAVSDFSHVPVVNEDVVFRALIYSLARFGIPLFILISGFVLYNRYATDVPLGNFYSRRFKKVLIPYLIFSIIYLGYRWIEYGWIPSPGKCLLMLLTGTSFYHLGFVMLIIQLYLLYPLLARLYRWCEQRDGARRLLLGALVFQTLTNIGLKLLKGSAPVAADHLGLLFTFMEFISYFFLGFWAARNRKKLDMTIDRFVRRYALLMALIYLFGVSIYAHGLLLGLERYGSQDATPVIDKIPFVFTRVFTDICSLIMVYQGVRYLMRRPGVGSSFILRVGALSYGFYLLHPMMLSLAGIALRRWFSLSGASAIASPLLYVLTVISTYAVVSLINRMPFSELFIGKTEGSSRQIN